MIKTAAIIFKALQTPRITDPLSLQSHGFKEEVEPWNVRQAQNQIKSRSRDTRRTLNDHRQSPVISRSAPALGRRTSDQQESDCRRSSSSYLLSFWSSSWDAPLTETEGSSVWSMWWRRNVNQSRRPGGAHVEFGDVWCPAVLIEQGHFYFFFFFYSVESLTVFS